MLTDRTTPAEDVAHALGISVPALKRKFRRLHATKGFPLPLPGATWRWSTRALEDWIYAAGMPRPTSPEDDEDAETNDATNVVSLRDDLVRRQHLALRERYGVRS